MTIVEDAMLDGDELCQHPVPCPGSEPDDRPKGVETSSHISSLARRDQSARPERDFLTPHPYGEQARPASDAQFSKRLVELETVLVSGTRAAGASRLDTTLKFGKESDASAGVQIGMHEVPLQDVSVRVLRP
jgi:hypothetical protein